MHPLLRKSTESVAQQVEHIPFKDGVLGSSPSWFTQIIQFAKKRAYVGSLFICICAIPLLNPIQKRNTELLIL